MFTLTNCNTREGTKVTLTYEDTDVELAMRTFMEVRDYRQPSRHDLVVEVQSLLRTHGIQAETLQGYVSIRHRPTPHIS